MSTLRLTGSTSGYTEVTAPAVAGSNTLVLPSTNGSAHQLLKNSGTAGTLEYGFTLPSGNGTADQALVTNGSGTLSFADRGRMVLETAKASTSGTSIDFASIPSWVKRVTVVFNAVSTNGTSVVQIQLGDSGGVATSGYFGGLAAITGTNTSAFAAISSGFAILGADAANQRAGILSIVNITADTWVASGTFDNSATQAGLTQGAKSLSGTLDRIRITTVNGTDTFDAGSINLLLEG